VIDGNSPKWRHRVLMTAAANIVDVFVGTEREALIKGFAPAEHSIVRREIARLEGRSEDEPTGHPRDDRAATGGDTR
jgi:hypothetical protein